MKAIARVPMLLFGFGALLGLTGCATLEPVRLRHPGTGKTVTCSGWSGVPGNLPVRLMEQRSCVEDFQRQGYERVPH